MKTVPYYQGAHKKVEFLVLDNGKSPAKDFILSRPGTDNKAARLDNAIKVYADARPGEVINPQMFKKVEGSDGIFEFKAYQDRLFCFHTADRRVILLFPIQKKRDKHRRADITRAERLKGEFLSSQPKPTRQHKNRRRKR